MIFDDGDALPAGFGVAAAGIGAPNMIGDLFGNAGSSSVISRVFQVVARGDTSGTALISFEVGPDPVANDFFSAGPVMTVGGIDSVAITEPLPPTDAPTSPGPGFTFAGGTATTTSPFAGGDFWDAIYSYNATVIIPAGGGGGGGGDFVVGRVKLAENASPIPQDRIFVNYSLFDNVPLQAGGVSVNRFIPGVEKTFYDGMMSLELRAPLASTLSSDIRIDAANDLSDVEFGDLFISYKALLFAGQNYGISAGVSVTAPTADDSTVSLADGTPLVMFENSAVHVMPFVGGVVTDGCWFLQGFLQVDVDVNGDQLLVNSTGAGLQPGGQLQETTLLYADVGAGFWMYQDQGCRWIQGIAPTVELHFNRSLQDTDVIRAGSFQIGQPLNDIQILNAVVGATVVAGESNVSIGYSTPCRKRIRSGL